MILLSESEEDMCLIEGAFMTNEEVTVALREYDDCGFEALPGWLQQELKVRHLAFGPRKPTPMEIEETKDDALMHRILNNEETLDDMYNQYCKGEHHDFQRG